MRKPLLLAAAAGLAIALTLSAVSATATHRTARTFTVQVRDDRYFPSRITAHVGDNIRFVWSPRNITEHDADTLSAPRRTARWTTATYIRRRTPIVKRLRASGRYTVICTVHGFTMRITATANPRR